MSKEPSQIQVDEENHQQSQFKVKSGTAKVQNNNINDTKSVRNIANRDRQVLTNLHSENSQMRQNFTNMFHNHGINNSNNHGNSNSNLNQAQTQTQTQSDHLTAISGMTMRSPFYTNTVNLENNSSLQMSKQIQIKQDKDTSKENSTLPDILENSDVNDENDENDENVPINEENESVTEHPKLFNEEAEETNDDYQNAISISMAERTEEQIQDENRRMSLKRQAPVDVTDLIEPDRTQELKRVRVDYDYTWEDLDSGDFDDPLMVSEYVHDIFEYLHELEVKTLPDPNYLQMQRNLRPKMRSILVDWMVEVHLKFKLLPETLYLSINLMDRFLSKELVQVDRLQLLATGSLFIAAKYEEVYSPSIKNYAYVTDGAFSEDEILGAERFILEILNFNMSYPNPMNFLRRISKADDYDVNTRTIGKYLLEITVIDHKFIGYLPSLCSAASMFISRRMVGKNDWNGNLIHYSGGYKINDLQEVCVMIMDYLVSPIVHEEFFKKYASRKFMKVSILARQWAKKLTREGKNIMDDEL